MSDDAYRTVAEAATASFVVRGSEFIGHVAPVDSVEAAEAVVESVRAEYADATHNVPAYRVRTGEAGDFLREYQRDEGEPSGSAGKPALNVLQGRDLENVVAVVTRYYGGTNLGVGGLVSAYSRAVSEAVDAAGVVEERPQVSIRVETAYDDSGTVRGILESADVSFEATYRERVTIDVRVARAECDQLVDRIRSATSDRAVVDVDPS